jgi:biopolymer transport protein ExbD
MGKVKPHRSSPTIDMTPMVDLAFLLVTFFMLTAKFRPEEPVQVTTPKSNSQIIIPENDVLTLTLSKEGAVYIDVSGKSARKQLITNMGEKYGISFTEEEKEKFAGGSSIAIPMGNMKQFLALDLKAQKAVKQPGIPKDTAQNELVDWIKQARLSNTRLRVAIKGDENTKFPEVNKVLKTLQETNVTVFNLLTSPENDK